MNEPTAPSPLDSSKGSTLRAYLQLVRIPNLFTAVADVMMGYFVTHPLGIDSYGVFALLVGTSCLLYMAGMVLNDVFDVEADARRRPERPIPSGTISLRAARRLGAGLLPMALVLAITVSQWVGDVRAAVAISLAICIVAYDRWLKRTPLGPVAMGACRTLNVLLGMSVAAEAWQPWNVLVALGIGVYIVGVTWFARREDRQSSRWQLGLATLVMLTGMAILAWLPSWRQIIVETRRWQLFWIVLALLMGWRFVRAIADPTPRVVQAAVKHALASLIVLDAAVCFAVCGQFHAIMILLLLIPTMFLGRSINVT